MTSRATLGAYLVFAAHTAGPRLLLAACLSVALGLVEGIGLLFLVPLLGLVGVDLGTGPAGHVAATIGGVLADLGLSPTLPVVLTVFVGVSVLQALVLMSQSLTNLRLEAQLATGLRTRVYEAVLHADWLFLTRQRGSDLTHILTEEIDRSGAIMNQSVAVVSGATQVVVAMLVATRLAPSATAVVAAASGMLLAIMRVRAARARRLGEDYGLASSGLFAIISDGLAAARTIKSFGAEDRSVKLVAAGQQRLVDIWSRAVSNHVHGKAWLDVASVTALAAIVYAAVEFFTLPPGALLVLLLIFARTIPRVIGLQQSAHLLLHALPAFGRAHALEVRATAAAEPGAAEGPVTLGVALRFEEVSFSYSEGRQALDGVTLLMPAHAITALVGASGAGKTTAADIALGLLVPDAGRVLIDDVPLTRDGARSWRTRVAYVSQDPFLFHDTIAANLRWARPDATEARIAEALARAGAADFVRQLPEGLETVVGDRGSRLSGGERQRLAIARALLREPELLVLDEPTSALDLVSEQHVLDTVRRLASSTTILLVTHRASAALVADRVYVVDGGRLVESGTPAEVAGVLRRTTA